MTAAAISSIAPSTSRAVSRSNNAGSQDGESSPFASLLAAEADEAPETAAVTADSQDVADKPAATETQSLPEAAPQLPVWLLALRAPPSAATDGAALAPDPLVDTAVKGSTMLPTVGLSLNDLRALKGRPGDTPPTQFPSLPPSDDRLAATATAATADGATAAPVIELLPVAEVTLDATQTAALDAAIGKLEAATAGQSPIAPVTGADRSTPVTAGSATISETSVASALNASLANQTDAFGEPLSLQGPDAALRLGERLRWLTESGVQEARMQLHPRELGSVDIRIRIEGQGASVWFGADHPGARAALEATLPQLRERLASEGLQMSQASVGSQTDGSGGNARQQAREDQSERQERFADSRRNEVSGRDLGSRSSIASAEIRTVQGLIDRYA